MRSRIGNVAAVSLSVLGLVGCANVPRSAGFGDVRHLVGQRTAQTIEWNGNTIDDQAATAAVNQMLTQNLTVDRAVQIGLLNNRHLQAMYEDLGIAQADLVQSGLLKNPVFLGSWRFPDRSPISTNAEYSVTQDFLDILVLPLRKRVAAQAFEGTKKSVAQEAVGLAVDVKTAYFTLQAREQLLDRLRLIVDLNQTASGLAQRQRDAGTINELGAINQQAIYDQSKVDVAQTEAQLTADQERLNRLLGLWGNQTQWKIADQLPPIPLHEIPLEHLEALAIHQRLDLAAARVQVAAFAQLLGVTETYRYFTSIELGIDTERSPDRSNVTGPTLSLQIPIFDQGQAQIAKTQSQLRQFQRRFEAMAVDARSEVREARDRMMAQRGLAEYYKVLLPERVRILNLTMQEYNGMLKGPYDLLLAKQTEVATEQSYIAAWRDYWIARCDLERAVGGRLPPSQPNASQPSATASSTHNESQPMQSMQGTQP